MNSVIGITGGTGFIGRHFLNLLVRKTGGKKNIVVLVRRSSPYREWVERLGVRIVWGSVEDVDSLFRFVALVNRGIIVHCAGFVGKDKKNLWRVNVGGTKNLLLAVERFGVKRLVYLSSVAVLSGNKDLPLRDDMQLRSSMDYGQSKLEAEQLVWKAMKTIPIVILRPGMVYGEGEPHLLPLIVRMMQKGVFFLFGKMENLWHMCGIENLLWVMERAMVDESMLGKAFICADEEILTAQEIFNAIAEGIGVRRLRRIPEWVCPWLEKLPKVGDVVRFMRKVRVYDISGIRHIGYRDIVSPRDGLVRASRSIVNRMEEWT